MNADLRREGKLQSIFKVEPYDDFDVIGVYPPLSAVNEGFGLLSQGNLR